MRELGDPVKIESLEILGFLDRKSQLKIDFHSDLNIITGFNGAGKTNLLKLIWYTVSGNTHALLNEVEFSSFSMKTSKYQVSIQKLYTHTCRGTFVDEHGDEFDVEDTIDDDDEEESFDARDKFNHFLSQHGASLFFPTFRRIEGGFTTTQNARTRNPLLFNSTKGKGELQEALASVSRKLSNGDHTFVTSISTFDIAELLLRHFNELSEEANGLQTKMSQDVIEKIRDFRRDTQFDSLEKIGQEAVEALDGIKTLIESVDRQRDRVMSPNVFPS
ncbi:AAA domain-containing protein [Sphingopyxis sp. YR583]|uniref:AAA family ATPase n=1 Tax=Sphingopyxis sp. YR583 TaxID=1881047 RepID=UPI0008A73D27|nr:AAA family ATPase [Sphingopyxis sp. YR583]SEH14339.1 AAA domain-containing protein [Sphingopyxis sp. YR583]